MQQSLENLQSREIHSDRKQICGGLWLGVGGMENERMSDSGWASGFQRDKNVLQLIMGVSAQLCDYTKATKLYSVSECYANLNETVTH